MNQAAYHCASYFQRVFRKMHGTVLFVRIIPTVLVSFSCVLLLFLSLVFGLSLPLVLRYLMEASLIGIASILSSYLLWEKVIEHPAQTPQKLLLCLLLCECALPLLSVLLMTFFLHWSFVFFALFPLMFGVSLLAGRLDRITRFLLCAIRLALLALAAIITLVYISVRAGGPNQGTILFSVLLCCGLYFVYSLRFIFLLARDPAPYTQKELSRFGADELFPAVPDEEPEEYFTEDSFPEGFWEEAYEDEFPQENDLDEDPCEDEAFWEDSETGPVSEEFNADADMAAPLDEDEFWDEDYADDEEYEEYIEDENFEEIEEEPPEENPSDGPEEL